MSTDEAHDRLAMRRAPRAPRTNHPCALISCRRLRALTPRPQLSHAADAPQRAPDPAAIPAQTRPLPESLRRPDPEIDAATQARKSTPTRTRPTQPSTTGRSSAPQSWEYPSLVYLKSHK